MSTGEDENMKKGKSISVILIFLFLTLPGCGEEENPIQEYGDNLIGALEKAERAKLVSSLPVIRAQLMQYKIQHGRYPESLEELSLQDVRLDALSYNPKTGEVRLKE